MHSNSADVVCSWVTFTYKTQIDKILKKERRSFIRARHSHRKSQADNLCRVLKQLAAGLELQRFRQQGWGLLDEFLKVRCRTMFIQCGLVCVSEKQVVSNRWMINVIKLKKRENRGQSVDTPLNYYDFILISNRVGIVDSSLRLMLLHVSGNIG